MRLAPKKLPMIALVSAVMLPALAQAQPLQVPVSPSGPSDAGNMVYVEPGGVPIRQFGYTANSWMITDPPSLKVLGPSYEQPSGIRIGRGSYIPDWIDTAPVQNISVGGLQPDGYYTYFISPDRRTVVLDPASRRVVRVLR